MVASIERATGREKTPTERSTRADDLGCCRGQGPKRRLTGQETKEFGDNVGGKTVHILDFVKTVVNHEGAGTKTKAQNAEVGDRLSDFLQEGVLDTVGRFGDKTGGGRRLRGLPHGECGSLGTSEGGALLSDKGRGQNKEEG